MKALHKFRQLLAALDARPVRERAIVFALLLVVMYMATDNLAIQPVLAQQKVVRAEHTRLQAQLDTLRSQSAAILQRAQSDPDATSRKRLRQLQADLVTLNASLKATTGSLMPPEQMAVVLEKVLDRETPLRLIKLEGLGADVVTGSAQESASTTASKTAAGTGVVAAVSDAALATGSGNGIYRHGLRVEFSGSYLDTLAYLKALEQLEWGFIWDAVEFVVDDYPKARAAITVYTLSLSDGWIGV